MDYITNMRRFIVCNSGEEGYLNEQEVDGKDEEREEYEDTMKRFYAIQESDIFSHKAEASRNAFEAWLFCNGSREEKIKFWNMFKRR